MTATFTKPLPPDPLDTCICAGCDCTLFARRSIDVEKIARQQGWKRVGEAWMCVECQRGEAGA